MDHSTDPVKATASDWIDRHRARLSEWHRTIWDLAEPAWREYRSAQWYVDRLRREGFEVEAGSGSMPTAFDARWTNGAGPHLLTYAEYDAVPGNCQAASTTPEPRSGLNRWAPGHTDPHSALGISTLAGLLAAKSAMIEHGITGTLRYTGEPAEKVQGSKVVHGLRGYYDDVDAIVSFHPFYMLPLCNTARWDTHCAAYYSKIYTFRCDEPELWGVPDLDSPIPASHSAARAPGADAALVSMFQLTKTTQDAMLPSHGGWSLSEAILTAGQATADNLPHSIAQIQYSWRCADVAAADSVMGVLDRNAQLAAAATHCQVSERWVARNRPGLPNHTLARLMWANLELVGAPEYGPDAVQIAQQLQKAVGVEPMAEPFLPETEQLIAPWDAEARLRRHIIPVQRNWTSDDYTEMTWYAPTVRFYVARPALRTPPGQAGYPSWVMNAMGGIPATIDPTVVTAGKAVATFMLDVLRQPDVLAQARAEHVDRIAEYGNLPCLLPSDFSAPVDYRWPEYVDTPRGTGWWIPNNAEV